MRKPAKSFYEKRKPAWELFILILSLYAIFELAFEIVYPLSQSTVDVINTIDLVICIIFLIDFFYFLYKAENKIRYLKTHWIDFIASIPYMSVFRVFRAARVIRIVRLLRGLKGVVQIFRALGTSRLQNIMFSYIIVLLVFLFYCSMAFYTFEHGVNQNVNSLFDAFWWGFITITTVGYGDIYPFTIEGRIIGMILTLLGIGLFSLITAQLATYMMKISSLSEKEKKKDDSGESLR